MRARVGKWAIGAAVVLAVAAGLVLLGRATVDTGPAREHGYRDGKSAGFSDGLQAGRATGRQEGRALELGASVPQESRAAVQAAFNAGYTAGQNDVFAGYDGGWILSAPYVITLGNGSGKITDRIRSRTLLEPNVNYFLCPNGHDLCQGPRR
jgi:hypothetical protein